MGKGLGKILVLFGTLAAGCAVLGRSSARRWINSFHLRAAGFAEHLPPALAAHFELLCRALRGLSKSQVRAALGRPASEAALEPAAPGSEGHTWYYPLDLRRRVALAITFGQNNVLRVEWIRGPA